MAEIQDVFVAAYWYARGRVEAVELDRKASDNISSDFATTIAFLAAGRIAPDRIDEAWNEYVAKLEEARELA